MARSPNHTAQGPVVYNSIANTSFGRSRFLTPTGCRNDKKEGGEDFSSPPRFSSSTVKRRS